MALSYTTVQAIINSKYLRVLENNIFTDNHYLLARMKAKAIRFDERKIVVPLEYAKATTVGFMSRYGTLGIRPEEIATAVEYEPKMYSGSLTLCLEDELENKSDQAIANILAAKVKNLELSMKEGLATHIWTRGALAATKNWNTIDLIVSATATLGGLDVASAAWWVANAIDATGTDYLDDPTSEADLVDPTKDVYLPKLLQRGVAKSKYLTGENPTAIILPQYLWDLLETLKDDNKLGSPMEVMVGNFGFSSIKFRNSIPIVADDDMVAAQTGDTDGRIYFVNDKYLYMFMNSGAKFKAGPFAQIPGSNVNASMVNVYGNICCSNRRAQTVITGVRSPQSYAA